MKMVSEDVERSPLPREKVEQKLETENGRSVTVEMIEDIIEEISPLPREEEGQEIETAKENMVENDYDEEKRKRVYIESCLRPTFFETLQFQTKNFIEFPASEANVHPLTRENRTRKEAVIALVLFFMR